MVAQAGRVALRRVVIRQRVRAAQHMPERGARVEPHLQDVAALAVGRCVVGAQDVLGAGSAPGFDAALLDDLGRLVKNGHRARVQLTGFFVQEKRHRHAPTALAADAPVRPVADHVAQSSTAIFRIKTGVADRLQRHLAQGFGRFVFAEHAPGGRRGFVHADEPLRRRPVDHRRLVAPAMRVAVADGLGGQQAAGIAQRVDDQRHRLPDIEAAKQRKVGRVTAVTLHRVQDVVGAQAVRPARVEVFHAVSRRAVHQAGAVIGGGVIGKVDGAQAVEARMHCRQRMVEGDAVQRLAQRGGPHRAGEAVARQAGGYQRRRQDQQATLGIDQRIVKRRVQVQRLVGRDGPGGGGPDDCKSLFIE